MRTPTSPAPMMSVGEEIAPRLRPRMTARFQPTRPTTRAEVAVSQTRSESKAPDSPTSACAPMPAITADGRRRYDESRVLEHVQLRPWRVGPPRGEHDERHEIEHEQGRQPDRAALVTRENRCVCDQQHRGIDAERSERQPLSTTTGGPTSDVARAVAGACSAGCGSIVGDGRVAHRGGVRKVGTRNDVRPQIGRARKALHVPGPLAHRESPPRHPASALHVTTFMCSPPPGSPNSRLRRRPSLSIVDAPALSNPGTKPLPSRLGAGLPTFVFRIGTGLFPPLHRRANVAPHFPRAAPTLDPSRQPRTASQEELVPV